MWQLFGQVATTPDRDTRVVSGKGVLDPGGDGRGAYVLLSPIGVQYQLVVDLYLHGHGKKTAGREASSSNSVEDKEYPANNLLRGLSNREGMR